MATHPHDALFRYTFTQPQHAVGELWSVLPAELAARMKMSTLRAEPASFVDAHLEDRITDVLYSVELDGGRAYVYVLFEHQSQPDGWMPLRLLRYMVRIWSDYARPRGGQGRLPVVVPVVLHHGERPWQGAKRLGELLELDDELAAAAGSFVPDFEFVVDDLSSEDTEALQQRSMTAMARLVLWCFKRGPDVGAIAADLAEWASVAQRVWSAPDGVEAMGAVLRYIRLINDEVPEQALEQQLAEHWGPQIREVYVTEGERLIQQGLERGREQGLEQGREQGLEQGREQGLEQGQRELLRRLLRARFGELGEQTATRLETATRAELERWAERVLTARTLAEVFER